MSGLDPVSRFEPSGLERLIAAARTDGVDWSRERADRVLRATVRRHEQRGRIARRALAVASAAAVVVLFVLRGAASSAAAEPGLGPSGPASDLTASSLSTSGDGGYARD
ncbi:MAG: hypothetical protein U0270_26730 [Labilithrix sp.]